MNVAPVVLLLLVSLTLPPIASQAETRQALAAAARERVALTASIARLTAENARRAKIATNEQTVTHADAIATDAQADNNASIAQQAVVVAEKADARAVDTAHVVRSQTEEILRVAAQNSTALYTTLGLAILTFLTLLVNMINKWNTDTRTHAWQMAADAAKDKATKEHRAYELEQIAESIKASKAAFEIANTVNEKIASVGLQVRDGQPLSPPNPPKPPRVPRTNTAAVATTKAT